jgi:hypothetical protein
MGIKQHLYFVLQTTQLPLNRVLLGNAVVFKPRVYALAIDPV